MTRTVIVGGGPAGMSAAIAAARRGETVLLLERLDRVGKKLLATGNGRCNLMNRSAPSYPGGTAFARQVLASCGIQALETFFHTLGLRLRTEEMGRVYPASGQAATVLDALRLGLSRAGVELRPSCPVSALTQVGRGFSLTVPEGSLHADRVIVAGGGRAQPKLGSDGSAYALLTGLGHRLHRPFPALTQIETDTAPLRGLSGIRVRTEAWITTRSGQELHRTQGEALFADYGMSGVCIMQLARFAQGRGTQLHLNLLPALGMSSADELLCELRLRRRRWAFPLEQLLTGLCVPRLGAALLRQAGIAPLSRPISSLRGEELHALAAAVCDFTLEVHGVKGFDSAQVSAGGIAWEDFVPETLSSRLIPRLHAAGEVLDVDGDCGGYNLMFAFASGLLAGSNGQLKEVLA